MPLDQAQQIDLWKAAVNAVTKALYIVHHGSMLNERYLHHYLSRLLQESHPLLDLAGPTGDIKLHPEWPTFKKATGIDGGRYKGIKKRYQPDDVTGTEGAIDFALGDYDRPEIGIELLLKESWNGNEVAFDFLKLLDGRNKSFKSVIGWSVLLRDGEKLSQAGRKQNIYDGMKEALAAAKNMLADYPCPLDRRCVFIVSEIAKQDRRHWYWDLEKEDFVPTEGTPPVLTAGTQES